MKPPNDLYRRINRQIDWKDPEGPLNAAIAGVALFGGMISLIFVLYLAS